ncbi:hypothetical protein N6H05_19600 [Sphingobium sp. WTD-1]|uniref:hypothetical protein n=1 Tax=Sphingobium sp. WTD-1 TaxID=2979467 RepID=UPI0024DEFD68|nr:hypothetical protein [Sphingobium sp. WTD-1]WIA55216.1 hypothetical protein N6H05_19600 [Sphingobium sp. WTD-1]
MEKKISILIEWRTFGSIRACFIDGLFGLAYHQDEETGEVSTCWDSNSLAALYDGARI